VKPGTPFHMVIDEQSMRKVPHCIGFDENQRVFGNGATSLVSHTDAVISLSL
jgi:hypothetical protein